jgi:hypothetical protein
MFKKRELRVNGSLLVDTDIKDLKYAFSHGVSESNTLPVIFELATFIKPKVCVIIGTGDGLIPRVIREAQVKSRVENSRTYLVDLGENMGAMPEKIHNENSVFRRLYPEIIVFKGYSVPNGFDFISNLESSIDLLWIDGDHSHEVSLSDFYNYSKLLIDNGLIFLHDTAPEGVGKEQPEWCGVDKTIKYINKNYKNFECVNFTKTEWLNLGAGFAIVKKNLYSTPLSVGTNAIVPNPRDITTDNGKNWDYLYSKQFILRQQFLATLLTDSQFVLDIGCYPLTIGKYLSHKNYLAVDPLYPSDEENIRSCCLKDLQYDISENFDMVLLGIDLPCDEILLNYCKKANKIIIEYPISYKPSEEKFKKILNNTNKLISYDFIMNFSGIPVKVDLNKSWPPRYVRRIVVLE